MKDFAIYKETSLAVVDSDDTGPYIQVAAPRSDDKKRRRPVPFLFGAPR